MICSKFTVSGKWRKSCVCPQAQRRRQSSQPAQKYAENSGIALVMKGAPTSHAGSVSSLLGVLQYAFAGVSGAALALAYDATLTPFITAMLLCAVGAQLFVKRWLA
jgi:hypothetical protein